MHYRTTHLRPTLLALGLGLLAAASVRAQSSQTAPLAGLWRLNPDLSDHMEDKLQNARRPGAYTGMAGGGRHGGGGGGRGGGGHGMRREGREGGLEGEELGNLIHPILQVLIRQDDSTVAISDAAGQMQTFYLDGRKIKEPLLTGGDLETVAKWKDAKLTIERKQDKGGTLKETWDIDPVTRKLVLTIKLSTPMLPHALEFRRVYDPAPPT